LSTIVPVAPAPLLMVNVSSASSIVSCRWYTVPVVAPAGTVTVIRCR
jgi:hypothetical protein